jgi:hypothetical protein
LALPQGRFLSHGLHNDNTAIVDAVCEALTAGAGRIDLGVVIEEIFAGENYASIFLALMLQSKWRGKTRKLRSEGMSITLT